MQAAGSRGGGKQRRCLPLGTYRALVRAAARRIRLSTLNQLLSLMARSPGIARRGDRFAYDRPEGAAAQAGGVEPEPIGFGHHLQDLPPRLGGGRSCNSASTDVKPARSSTRVGSPTADSRAAMAAALTPEAGTGQPPSPAITFSEAS